MKSLSSFIASTLLLFLFTVSVSAQVYDHNVEISPADMVRELRADGKIPVLEAILDAKLDQSVQDPILREALKARFHYALENGDPDSLARFPLVPLAKMKEMRGLFQMEDQGNAPSEKEKVEGDLATVMAAMEVSEWKPEVLHEALPELKKGELMDESITPEKRLESMKVARVLSALANGNGSFVNLNGKKIENPEAFFTELLGTGHRVALRSERTHANFVSFIYKGKSVRWPGWLATGIPMGNFQQFVVPMGHSQIVYDISGPTVNARVKFFLGLSGVGFYPGIERRPGWAGLKLVYTLDSDDVLVRGELLAGLKLTSLYTQRILKERATGVPNAAKDGYGYLGVCNDSVALMEKQVGRVVTSFPLLRAPELDVLAPVDELDEPLRSLAKDSSPSVDKKDMARRILEMNPFDLSSDSYIDQALKDQMNLLDSMKESL